MFRTRELLSFKCDSAGGRDDTFQAGSLCIGNIDNSSDRASKFVIFFAILFFTNLF